MRARQGFGQALKPETELGIHAHHNLTLGVANAMAGRSGRMRIDASLAGMGAGAGNAPLEAFIAALDRMGSRRLRSPQADGRGGRSRAAIQDRPVRVDRESLALGYAGVYSCFLRHAEKASKHYGIDTRDILVELGRRRMVGGQEDMIVDVALDILKTARSGDRAMTSSQFPRETSPILGKGCEINLAMPSSVCPRIVMRRQSGWEHCRKANLLQAMRWPKTAMRRPWHNLPCRDRRRREWRIFATLPMSRKSL